MSPQTVSRTPAKDLTDDQQWFVRKILDFETGRYCHSSERFSPWGRHGSGGGMSNVPLQIRHQVYIQPEFEAFDKTGNPRAMVEVTPAAIYDTIMDLLEGKIPTGFPVGAVDVVRCAWEACDLSLLSPTHRDLILQVTCGIQHFHDRRGDAYNPTGVTARPEVINGQLSFHDEYPYVSVRRDDIEIHRIPFDPFNGNVSLETSREAREAFLKGVAAGWSLHASAMRQLLGC